MKSLWPIFAKEIRHKRAGSHSNWCWHIDEVFVKINGDKYCLWRAINHEGTVLESYVLNRRDRRISLKVLRKLFSKYGSPVEIVTDKLGSYGVVLRGLGIRHRHETGKYENNQAENSHPMPDSDLLANHEKVHFRRRERAMGRFRSMASLQKFSSIHAAVLNQFSHQRHFLSRPNFRYLRDQSLTGWRNLCIGSITIIRFLACVKSSSDKTVAA